MQLGSTSAQLGAVSAQLGGGAFAQALATLGRIIDVAGSYLALFDCTGSY